MTRLSLQLSVAAEATLKKKIAHKVGTRARTLVTALHQKILDATAMNSGRTLASWWGSAGTAIYFDAESRFGSSFSYDPERFPETNSLPVGAEPGRGTWERFSLSSTKSIKFEQNPYQKFFITNGASLDSITESSLPQGVGSRALQQEYGIIAAYDLYRSTPETQVYTFTPRTKGAFRNAVASFRLTYGK